jgi:hypothetical protein
MSVCLSALLPDMQCAVFYCHLCPAPLYSIIPHYLTNGTIFEKKVTEHKICFHFLYKSYLKISLPHGAAVTPVRRSSCKVPVILEICFLTAP